ncbi:MAG: apolipoprotein N-acyltransferase [Spirochaetaceae bacterium]|jgi:apolipoprotein N-acyltransferase|nr:apolipoprotein N-acyltransferase [Spirochaetaceae bacterium]
MRDYSIKITILMGLETLFSAALLALALPNDLFLYGNPLYGFFALCPYFLCLSRSRSFGQAAFLGLVFGVFSHGFSSYWLAYFKEFAFWTLGLSCLVYGALHAFLACFLRRACLPFSTFPLRISRPLALALAWTVWEWLKSSGFLGYPWGLLPYALNDHPWMIQIADFTGVWGLSFLLALSSALSAELVMGLRYTKGRNGMRELLYNGPLVCFWLALFASISIYGLYRLSHPVLARETVPIILVQPNADAWNGSELGALSEAVRLSNEGYKTYQEYLRYRKIESEAPPLIVWPETLLARPFEEYRSFFAKNPREFPLLSFLKEKNAYLLTGAPLVQDWEQYTAFNGAILISPEGTLLASYAKQHLVPFAEAVPFIEKPWMASFMRKVVGFEGGWSAGKVSSLMELPLRGGGTLRIGTPICFEDAFARLCGTFFAEGADMLVNLTNDSWARQSSAEIQHLAAARFRTVENRRVLARAANSGLSAVINAEGKILASLPCFEAAVLVSEVPVQIPERPTVYSVLGDWFPLCCGILFCLMLIGGLLKPGAPGQDFPGAP